MTPAQRIQAARVELAKAERALVAALREDRTRNRAPLVRQLHEVRLMTGPAYPYASQAGQDAVVDRALGRMTGGTFVDIGAYDGLTGSNSLFFERCRGWSGVMVEPVASQRAQALAHRRAPCLPYAVAPEAGEASFIAVTKGFTQMSGLVDSYDAEMLTQVRADPRHVEEMVTVQTLPLQQILYEADLPHPDFVSLDIEGAELAVLRSFPFADHRIRAWAIENNTGVPEIGQIMRENGYNLIEFCGPDEIYLHRDFDSKTA